MHHKQPQSIRATRADNQGNKWVENHFYGRKEKVTAATQSDVIKKGERAVSDFVDHLELLYLFNLSQKFVSHMDHTFQTNTLYSIILINSIQ